MARGSRFSVVKDRIKVGMKSYGWECTALYPNHNLWIKESKKSGTIFRESFPKHAVPNENANYNVLEE